MTMSEYDLWLLIHQESIALYQRLGHIPDPKSAEIFWAVRYVTCRVSNMILKGPTPGRLFVKSRRVLGQSVSFGIDESKSSKGELDNCEDFAAEQLGILRTSSSPMTGVKSIGDEFYPGRNRRLDIDLPVG